MRAFLRSVFVLACAVAVIVPILSSAVPVTAQAAVSCDDFDAWPWAQTVMESDPDRLSAALDPDGNGIACENLTINGFAPVLWADRIPASVEKATIVSITDGDTFKVDVNGAVDTVRMYHIDTPETSDPYRPVQCGGAEATNYLTWMLSLAPNGTVYLEYDQTQRDKYDRRLAYVWMEIDGDLYMVNEVMVRNGWAESETYKPDTKYKEQLDTAEKFSVDKVNGVRLLCGKFGQPADGTAGPSKEQLRQAMNKQPHQGQFAAFTSPQVPQQAAQPEAPVADAPVVEEAPVYVPPVAVEQPQEQAVVEQPVYQEPAPEPVYEEPVYEEPVYEEPAPAPSQECDPSYPDFCLEPSWVIGDLDCGDIGYRRFTVYPPDSHGFDGDADGIGCES